MHTHRKMRACVRHAAHVGRVDIPSNAFAFANWACLIGCHFVSGVPPAAPALAAMLLLDHGRQHREDPRVTFDGFPFLVRHSVAMQAYSGNFTSCQPYGAPKNQCATATSAANAGPGSDFRGLRVMSRLVFFGMEPRWYWQGQQLLVHPRLRSFRSVVGLDGR